MASLPSPSQPAPPDPGKYHMAGVSASANETPSIVKQPRRATTARTIYYGGGGAGSKSKILSACVVLVVLICIDDVRKDGRYMSNLVQVLSNETTTIMSSTTTKDEMVVDLRPLPQQPPQGTEMEQLQQQRQVHHPLPPVHYNSTWLGDTWIPSSDGYKLYSAPELAEYYNDHSVLVVGDSTARRFYATLYEILKLGSSSSSSSSSTSEKSQGHHHIHDIRTDEIDSLSILNINKNNKITEVCNQTIGGDISTKNQTYQLCRIMPAGSGKRSGSSTQNKRHFDLLWSKQTQCFQGLTELLKPPRRRPLSTIDKKLYSNKDEGEDDPTSTRTTTSDGVGMAAGSSDLWHDLVSGRYTIVVIIIGPLELSQEPTCGRGRLNNTEALLKTFQEYIEEYSSNMSNNHNDTSLLPRIVWRTWIGPGSTRGTYEQREASHKHADAINHKIKRRIDGWQRDQYRFHGDGDNDDSHNAVTYVDFGHIMRPRAWPQEVRIAGDIDMHIGLGGRLAMIQAMTNHLAEQDRQKLLGLPPWMAYHHDDGHAGDCRIASPFRRPEYCLTAEELKAAHDEILDIAVTEPPLPPEEQAVYEQDQERFCPSCIWNGKTNCRDRFLYLVHRYGDVPRNHHLHNLLEGTPSCVK